MELVITLPLNLPFGTISVDSGRKFAIEAKQWRTWMLQLVIFLTYQVGLARIQNILLQYVQISQSTLFINTAALWLCNNSNPRTSFVMYNTE